MTGHEVHLPGLWGGMVAVIRRDVLLAWKRPGDVMNPLFWLMVSLAAMAGALFAYPFNYWMARRGFLCWPGRLTVDGEARPAMPSLRSAWWALLLSIVLLIASLGLTVQSIS